MKHSTILPGPGDSLPPEDKTPDFQATLDRLMQDPETIGDALVDATGEHWDAICRAVVNQDNAGLMKAIMTAIEGPMRKFAQQEIER